MADDSHFHITSHNQQGGITAGQVYIGGNQRTMNDADKRFLLENLPMAVPVQVISTLGDTEGLIYAAEIKDFLRSNGYQVDGAQAISSAPVIGVTIFADGTPRQIRVGANPR